MSQMFQSRSRKHPLTACDARAENYGITPDRPDGRAEIRRLIHALSETLTAADAYLYAGRKIEDAAKLREAMGKAHDQIERADENVVKMRAFLDGKGEP